VAHDSSSGVAIVGPKSEGRGGDDGGKVFLVLELELTLLILGSL
jgi:hypothetical protein